MNLRGFFESSCTAAITIIGRPNSRRRRRHCCCPRTMRRVLAVADGRWETGGGRRCATEQGCHTSLTQCGSGGSGDGGGGGGNLTLTAPVKTRRGREDDGGCKECYSPDKIFSRSANLISHTHVNNRSLVFRKNIYNTLHAANARFARAHVLWCYTLVRL